MGCRIHWKRDQKVAVETSDHHYEYVTFTASRWTPFEVLWSLCLSRLVSEEAYSTELSRFCLTFHYSLQPSMLCFTRTSANLSRFLSLLKPWQPCHDSNRIQQKSFTDAGNVASLSWLWELLVHAQIGLQKPTSSQILQFVSFDSLPTISSQVTSSSFHKTSCIPLYWLFNSNQVLTS